MKKIKLLFMMLVCVLFVLSGGQSLAQEITRAKSSADATTVGKDKKMQYDKKTKTLTWYDSKGNKYSRGGLKNNEEATKYYNENVNKSNNWDSGVFTKEKAWNVVDGTLIPYTTLGVGRTNNYDKAFDLYNSGNWTDATVNTDRFFSSPTYLDGAVTGYPLSYNQSGGANKLSIVKTLKDPETFNKKSNFEVEEDQKSFSIQFHAKCTKSKITLTISSPNNKTFKEIVVNDGESRSWSKNIRLTEEENEGKYVGEWVFSVRCDDTLGSYRIEVSSR
ncbi:hypothetical protein ACFLRG_03480 [Bacteroidota bacterium]